MTILGGYKTFLCVPQVAGGPRDQLASFYSSAENLRPTNKDPSVHGIKITVLELWRSLTRPSSWKKGQKTANSHQLSIPPQLIVQISW